MKKFALLSLAAIPVALFVVGVGCDGGSNVVDCSANGDADCSGDTPICDDTTQSCTSAECDNDGQCQATDIGANAPCTATADCDAGDACIPADLGNNHCVTIQAAGDPACADIDATLTEVSATDTDGTSVTFCGDTGVTCADPGRCAGGTFG